MSHRRNRVAGSQFTAKCSLGPAARGRDPTGKQKIHYMSNIYGLFPVPEDEIRLGRPGKVERREKLESQVFDLTGNSVFDGAIPSRIPEVGLGPRRQEDRRIDAVIFDEPRRQSLRRVTAGQAGDELVGDAREINDVGVGSGSDPTGIDGGDPMSSGE